MVDHSFGVLSPTATALLELKLSAGKRIGNQFSEGETPIEAKNPAYEKGL
jgi:hypothetical protein